MNYSPPATAARGPLFEVSSLSSLVASSDGASGAAYRYIGGALPFTASSVTSTETISEPGISNIASKRSFSKIARSPLAPVFFAYRISSNDP